MRHHRLLVPTALALLPLIFAGSARAEPASTAGAVVRVQATKQIGAISPNLLGSNNDSFWDDSHGLWDSEAGEPNPEVVAKTRQAGVKMVRFPGGTPAALYDWKAGIGPVEERGCQAIGRANGKPGAVDSRYGTDEYLAFIDAIGGTADIMTPMVNQTAGDAADWVEYLNAPVGSNPRGGTAWAEKRAANGHPEPYAVQNWEIGNEPDRTGQRYWRSADPEAGLRQYAFGGSEPQQNQRLARGCDRTAAASISNGLPDQHVEAFYPAVVPDSQTVYVDGTAWKPVADLSRADAGDQVYAFAPATGQVTFGDGVHGKIPPKGAPFTIDYTNAPKPGFVDFYREMKKADPTIDVLATWAPIRPEQGLGTASFAQLMADRGMADQYDGVIIHPYTSFAVDFGDEDWETAREGHDEHMLGEGKATDLVRDLIKDVRRHSEGKAYVATSEFGALWFGQFGDISSYPSWQTSLSHGTYMASQWAHFSQLGLPWAMGNTLISEAPQGLRAVFGGAPGYAYTTDAVIREQLSVITNAGGQTVETHTQRNPMIKPAEPEEDFGSYPALATTAVRGKDGQLRVVVVNRAPETEVRAKVVTAGFRHSGAATVTTVTGKDFTSFNSADHPDDVKITSSKVDLGRGTFTSTFGPHSVSVITLTP